MNCGLQYFPRCQGNLRHTGNRKKTAEKLILELKDKLNIEDMLEHAAHGGDSEDLASGTDTASNTMQAEAVQGTYSSWLWQC